MRIEIGGEIDELRRRLGNPHRLEKALRVAVLTEAHWMRTLMIKRLKFGTGLAPNAPTTVLLKGSSKPLIKSAAMLNSISVIRKGSGVFVGIKRSSRKGVNLAILHERGAVIRQTVTPRQRRFFMFLSQEMYGRMFAPAVGSQITIRIPARPFITPVMEKFAPEMTRRIARTFASKLLAGDFGDA